MSSHSIDPTNASSEGAEDALYSLLKGAEQLENNENESTGGETATFKTPIDYNAPDPDAERNTSAAKSSNHDTRIGVVERSLSGKSTADKAHRSLISQNFEHGASGDYVSHSIHLKPNSVEKLSFARSKTLAEAVKEKTGHY